MPEERQKMVRLGALWLSKSGTGVATGKFGDARILVMPNNKKTSPNAPDYYLCAAEDDSWKSKNKPAGETLTGGKTWGEPPSDEPF